MWEAGESIVSLERRYSLTRVCLSRGQISCTQSLSSFFPANDKLEVVDTITGDVIELQSNHSESSGLTKPKIILGLRNFYQKHALQVNDTVLLKYAEEGDKNVIHITPVRARRKMDLRNPSALKALVDHVANSPTPLSESDVHGLYPELPHNLDLNALFRQDQRITKHEGRWQNAALRAAIVKQNKETSRKEASAAESLQTVAQEERNLVSVGAIATSSNTLPTPATQIPVGQVLAGQIPVGQVSAESGQISEQAQIQAQIQAQMVQTQVRAPNESLGQDVTQRIEAFHKDTLIEVNTPDENTQAAQTLRESIAKSRPAFFAPNKQDNKNTESHRTNAIGSGTAEIASSISGNTDSNASSKISSKDSSNATPSFNNEISIQKHLTQSSPQQIAQQVAQHGVQPDALKVTGDYAALHKQAREKLEPLGFSVSSIEQGQLLLRADMARDNYTVLMYLLPDFETLNWPSALAQRLKTDAKYLSILGNSNELLKLDNSASFVRATRWSWQALDRILQINEHMAVGPAVLEPCFNQTGLDLPQVEVFQDLLNQHLEEVGFFSEIIQSVASRKTPSVFILDDIMTDLEASGSHVSRESVVSILRTLSQIPFNLIEITNNHEYVLNRDVSASLDRLEKYCGSLKANLPNHSSVERFTASDEDLLVTD